MATPTNEQAIETSKGLVDTAVTSVAALYNTDAEKQALGGESWRDVERAHKLLLEAKRFLEYAVTKNRYPGKDPWNRNYASVPALQSISATPASKTLASGSSETQQLTVMAVYADGTQIDVTAATTYVSSVTADATVSATGLVTAVSSGASTITCTFEGQQDTVAITTT